MLINLWDTSVACRVSGCRFHSHYLTNSSINIENRIQCKQGDAARHVSTKNTQLHLILHFYFSPQPAHFQRLVVKLHPHNFFFSCS